MPLLTAEEATARVAAGVAHFDRVDPCWTDTINFDTLNMADDQRCVLAQLGGGNFVLGMVLFGLVADDLELLGLDFNEDGPASDFAPLQTAWAAAITARRVPARVDA